MNEMEERVARALMEVTARPPAADALGLLPEIPVLASDPDFDDLPRDHTEGTQDDDITQEAVLRLARAAIITIDAALSCGSGDRSRLGSPTIEITPTMIEAGAEELMNFPIGCHLAADVEERRIVAKAIFMRMVASAQTTSVNPAAGDRSRRG